MQNSELVNESPSPVSRVFGHREIWKSGSRLSEKLSIKIIHSPFFSSKEVRFSKVDGNGGQFGQGQLYNFISNHNFLSDTIC